MMDCNKKIHEVSTSYSHLNTIGNLTSVIANSIYPPGFQELQVDMTKHSPGAYMLVVQTDYGIYRRKIIKRVE